MQASMPEQKKLKLPAVGRSGYLISQAYNVGIKNRYKSRHIRSYDKANGILPSTTVSRVNNSHLSTRVNSKVNSAAPGAPRDQYYSSSLPDTKKTALVASSDKRGVSTAPHRLEKSEKRTRAPLPKINNLVKGPLDKDTSYMNGHVPHLKTGSSHSHHSIPPPQQRQRRSEGTTDSNKMLGPITTERMKGRLPPNFATKWANARADYSGRQPSGQQYIQKSTNLTKLPDHMKSRENTMYAINMISKCQSREIVPSVTDSQNVTKTPRGLKQRQAEAEAAKKWKTIDGAEVRREKPMKVRPKLGNVDKLERIKEKSKEITLKKPVVRITYKTKPKVRATNREMATSDKKLRQPSGARAVVSRLSPIQREDGPRPSSALDMKPSWPPVVPPRPGVRRKIFKRIEPLGKPEVNTPRVINSIYNNPIVPFRRMKKNRTAKKSKLKPMKISAKEPVVLSEQTAKKYVSVRKIYADTGKTIQQREKQFYEKLEKFQLETTRRNNQSIVEKQIEKMEQKQRQQLQLYRIRRRFTEDQLKRWSTQYVTGKILEHETKDRFIYGLPENLNEEPEHQVKIKRKRLKPKAKFSQAVTRVKNMAKYAKMFNIKMGPEPPRVKTPLMDGIDFVQIVETDEKGDKVDTRVDVKDYIADAKNLLHASNRDLDLDASQFLGASLRESRVSLDSLDLDTDDDAFERAKLRYGLDNISQTSVRV